MTPLKWFFYNSRHCIDDPSVPISAENFQKATVNLPKSSINLNESEHLEIPSYSRGTMRKTISPITEWRPFNPSDNKRLCSANENDPPIAVGHDRLLFEVVSLNLLRPIYWTLPLESIVSSCHWVFSDTLTPIDPSWDECLLSSYEQYTERHDTIHQLYDQALEDPQILNECAFSMEFRQDSDYLGVQVLYFNNMVYVFKADSTYLATKGTAQNILSGKTPRDAIAVLSSFDYDKYVEINKLPLRTETEKHHSTLPVKNLILIFHGVGQKLSDSYSRVNFVYAIDKLRIQISELIKSANEDEKLANLDGRFLILPVNWRMLISHEAQVNTERVIVPTLPNVRKPFVDALLDIPLYMSENRRPEMLTAAAQEANRLYECVLRHHPDFEKEGRVHVVGHSMGSLLTGDLLTRQPTKLDTPEAYEKAPFKFQTYNYFNTGSMLGLFLTLQEQSIVPRSEYEEEHKDDNEEQPRPLGCFAAQNVYNISHPCDLLSFLMNSTVKGAKDESVNNLVGPHGKPLEPAILPRNFEPINPENSNPGRLYKLVSAPFSWMGSKPQATPPLDEESCLSAKANQEVIQVQSLSKIKELQTRFQKLNENGQIDYRIPDFVGFAPTHYLKLITAHFDYWSNKDLARFLAIECSRKPGVNNTIPEHRVKWVQKY